MDNFAITCVKTLNNFVSQIVFKLALIFDRVIHKNIAGRVFLRCTVAYVQAKLYGGANVELLVIVSKMCNIGQGQSRCCVEYSLARTQGTMEPSILTERRLFASHLGIPGSLGSRVVSVLNSGAEGTGFKSQP